MKDKTAAILRIFLAVLLVISTGLFVIFYVKGEELTSTVLTWAYFLLALTAFITLMFPIVFFIMNPKKGLTALIALAGFAVLYLIAYYGLASNNVNSEVFETFNITPSISQAIGGILYMTYILGGLAILAIFYAGISSFFK